MTDCDKHRVSYPESEYCPECEDDNKTSKNIEILNAKIEENNRIIKSCEEAIKDLKRLIELENNQQKAYIYKGQIPNIGLEEN